MMIQIHKGSPADVGVLIALSRRTMRASSRPFLGDAAVEAFVGRGAVDQYVADHLEQSTVIVADGALLGYAVCNDNVIDLMMIHQPLHRRGFGTRLLQHCEASLFRHYRELTLESFADNDHANNFYLSSWTKLISYFPTADPQFLRGTV